MFTITALLVALAMAKTQQYENSEETAESNSKSVSGSVSGSSSGEDSSASEMEEEDAPKPQHYDEVLATDYKGHLYGASALYGSSKWKSWKIEYKGDHQLYQPAGVTFCGGTNDRYGRWLYAYVADSGDADHPGAVYQYRVERDAMNPQHFELGGQKAIYGGSDKVGMDDVYGWGPQATEAPAAEAAAGNATEVASDVEVVQNPPAPTDVVCDSSGGVFIDDKNHGQIVWNGNALEDDNQAWVSKDCANAVKGVEAGVKSGEWIYWATSNQEEEGKHAGVYRQNVKNDAVDCKVAVEEQDWLEEGGAVEKVADYSKGVWGVAVHSNNVLLAQGDSIYSAGEEGEWESPEPWSWDHKKVRKIASAYDRGVVLADEEKEGGGVYVVPKKGEDAIEIAAVPNAYGVAYYRGEEWAPEEDEEEDSASSIVFATFAAVAAAAAMF